MAKAARRASTGAANKPNNQVQHFVERIEDVDDEIDAIMGAAKHQTQPLRDDRKEIFKEAAEAGYAKAELAAVVRQRRLERRAAAVPDSLNEDQRANFEAFVAALGPLADTPLGEAATGAAAHA